MGLWAILKKFKQIETLDKYLAIVSITLLVLGLFNAITFEVQKIRSNRQNLENAMSQIHGGFSLQVETLPDIYYIILDAHARSDVLNQRFGYDNTAFITELENLGFFVARCSQSNYWQTEYSLTSALNMDYLQNFLMEND